MTRLLNEKTQIQLTSLMAQYKNQFTKSEYKIYQYIVKNKESVLFDSLTEIADSCNVGEATILRFCRKLGYKGYQDFKISLARETTNISKTKDTDNNSYVNKVYNSIGRVVDDTYSLINDDQLEEAINIISSLNKVLVFGVSSSGIAGLDMQNRLLRIGKSIEVFTDSHNQIMRSNSCDDTTVIIAISLTGSTKDIIDAVRIGKENHAKIVVITNYAKSPLSIYADTILLTSAKENPLDSGDLISKISQLFIIDLLCTGIALKNQTLAKSTKESIAKTISNKLY